MKRHSGIALGLLLAALTSMPVAHGAVRSAADKAQGAYTTFDAPAARPIPAARYATQPTQPTVAAARSYSYQPSAPNNGRQAAEAPTRQQGFHPADAKIRGTY